MLTKQTITVKDDSGCQFKATVQTVRDYRHGEIVERHYYAMGETAETLAELKTKIANK